MAESMRGLKRTHRCTEISTANIGENVTLMGWVQKSRNKGGIIFVDLRDRSGIVQLIFENGSIDEKGFEKATKLRSEFVIAVTGVVEARSGAVNNNLKTGEIEVRANGLRIPDRRKQQDKRRSASEIPFPGSEKTGYPEKSDDAFSGNHSDPSVYGK